MKEEGAACTSFRDTNMQKSTRSRTAYTGWIAAALVVGIVTATGFQDSTKIGAVDLIRVITESRIQGDVSPRVLAASTVRDTILDYMKIEMILTKEQCERFRDLELKEDKTDVENAEILAIKSAVAVAVKDFDEISRKPGTLTEDEKRRYDDYIKRRATTAAFWTDWVRVFDQELQVMAQEADNEMFARALTAAQVVAKQDGYSIVHPMTSVVYVANDITDKAIVEANR